MEWVAYPAELIQQIAAHLQELPYKMAAPVLVALEQGKPCPEPDGEPDVSGD